MAAQKARPIVIVTGATGGVGFGVCQRLIQQLARQTPPDALPQPNVVRRIFPGYPEQSPDVDLSDLGSDGLTLVLACRNVKKAQEARQNLYRLLDDDIAKQYESGVQDRHAEVFKQNLDIVIESLDLADLKSVFRFASAMTSKYSYVSHIVCNAGVVSLSGYDWILCVKQICREPIVAVTSPLFKLQTKGEMSVDGLGWVWQCNVFGHYVLFRELQPLLLHYKVASGLPARVLWTSSCEALPSCYDPKDWQLVNNDHSYEATKYQMDLLVGTFEARQQADIDAAGKKTSPSVRHLLEHPGVVKTNIVSSSLNNPFLEALAQLFFYFVRFMGSTNHLIHTYKSAISVVHLMLVPLVFITATARSGTGAPDPPLKFASQTTRFGREYVDAEIVKDWQSRRQDGEDLVNKCEDLYQKFVADKDDMTS